MTTSQACARWAGTASSLALALAVGGGAAAQTATPAGPSAAPAPAPTPAGEVNEVVVNGIPYRETVLPTRLSSSSTYGLDLNVMDTPRNTTLLSTTQLETLNIQDPRAFSYLTASSYTDSAFGTPNIPRIRGQYADVFYNGMRSSFTENGYGAPLNFGALANISITKGPASVVDGPGPGVGGEADFITKRPSLTRFQDGGSISLDTVDNRRIEADVGGPIIRGALGARLSYSGEDSGSYFYGHYMRRNAAYLAVRWAPNAAYQADFNTELNVEQYTENVGLNRVTQGLISHGLYAQGAPAGELYSSVFGGPAGGYPIGSPGNPFSPTVPILTDVLLTGVAPINTRVTIDQTPGTSSRATKYNAQLIQTYAFNQNLMVENNTFFDYQDSDNQESYYYSDASLGSWTFENRLDLKAKFDLPYGLFGARGAVRNESILGASFRFAHVAYYSDFNAETPSVFDLTTNPRLWRFSSAVLTDLGDGFAYRSPYGRLQYGVPGRDATSAGNAGVSDLYDTSLFVQDRLILSPVLSLLFGGRIDVVQDHTFDPLGGAVCGTCFTALPNGDPLPQSRTTGIYGLGDANLSAVYRPAPWATAYATFDWTQSENPNGGEGGINAYGLVPDHELLRQDSFLYEGGLKLNLLGDKLFAGAAAFDQRRVTPVGAAGTQTAEANIRGVEVELNFQPTRSLFATASYSYIVTKLSTAAGFYNYPAYGGNQYNTAAYNFVDGAGLFAVFAPGQKFNDPGIPQHVFNVLGNYKFAGGIGLRGGVQVTGPIDVTTSGKLDPVASSLVPQTVAANGYVYRSPQIPWQYSMNAAIFYEWGRYTAAVSVYNLTDQVNWQSAPAFYGNDFLVRNDPRTVELRLSAKY